MKLTGKPFDIAKDGIYRDIGLKKNEYDDNTIGEMVAGMLSNKPS